MSDEASLRSILDDLIDLFGWEDKTPLHAALHVKNAVNNLRADLTHLATAGCLLTMLVAVWRAWREVYP